ncbi:hypothetical protein SDC9_155644 [bioreactor metagenome]|uniref:Uncharacterized protein n=1 Tax=bioreactor metagenome TaxID=1076179 RepID=A0A645F4B5_9ZZZZ
MTRSTTRSSCRRPAKAPVMHPPTGWAPQAFRRRMTGRSAATWMPTWSSSDRGSQACPPPSSWRANMASRPSCWRPTKAPGAAPAAMAARARTPAGASTDQAGSPVMAKRQHSSWMLKSAKAFKHSRTWWPSSPNASRSLEVISTSPTATRRWTFCAAKPS